MSEIDTGPLERLQSGLEPILERLTQQSSHAVLEAGRCLEGVVSSTQVHYAEVEREIERLDADVQTAVGQAVQGQADAVAELVESLETALDERDELLSECSGLVAALGHEARQLDEIAGISKILTLLARVETAHIGEDGERFESTVEEMAALDRATRQLTRDLVRLQKQMRSALPIFVEGTAELQALNQAARGDMGASLENVRAASETLQREAAGIAQQAEQDGARLREASLHALSELMFQDPMIQDLQQLDVQLARVVHELHGTADDPVTVYSANLGTDDFSQVVEVEDQAEAGEVLLFDDDPPDLDAGEMLLF